MRFIIYLLLSLGLTACVSRYPTLSKPALSPTFYTVPRAKTVALTFDDGPNPRYTPQILKILSQNHIHATFFVTANYATQHPNIIQAILAQGSALGNHTYNHYDLSTLSRKQLQHEIYQSSRELAHVCGFIPRCFRPPYLVSNAKIKALVKRNYLILLNGQSSDDYLRLGAKQLTRRVLSHSRARHVLIFHDGPRQREQTVSALPAIIHGLRAKGLGFSTICQQHA